MAVALFAVLFLGGVIPGLKIGGGENVVSLTMWGPVPYEILEKTLTEVNNKNLKSFNINYKAKKQETYEAELINALASGQGPDLWLLPQDLILKHKEKVFIIPFSSFSQRAFKDAFAEEGELYLVKDGIIALPFMVDPIVLYWNRDLASSAGISKAPETWDEFVDFSAKMTTKDGAGNIIQSGAALGEFQNISNAKDIISLLVLQTNNPIVDPVSLNATFSGTGETFSQGAGQSAGNAVRFFTDFSDPVKTTYSWNRALPDSKSMFIGGSLAFYLGYAGEYKDIAGKNPHLNFDVAQIPQIKDGKTRATFARMQAVAISKSSPKINSAVIAAANLTGKDALTGFSEKTFLPPGRRDLLAENPKDSALSVFYKSVLISRAWLEPDPSEVSNLFRQMVESVLTGKKKISEAVSDAQQKLDIMLEPMRQELNKQLEQ